MHPTYDLQWALSRQAEAHRYAEQQRLARQERHEHWLREQPRRTTPWLLRLASTLRGA